MEALLNRYEVQFDKSRLLTEEHTDEEMLMAENLRAGGIEDIITQTECKANRRLKEEK